MLRNVSRHSFGSQPKIVEKGIINPEAFQMIQLTGNHSKMSYLTQIKGEVHCASHVSS